MDWQITATQDDGPWFDDYLKDIIAHAPKPLPEHDLRVGHVDVHWHQVDGNHVYVGSQGGSLEDQRFAEQLVWQQLRTRGFKRAVATLTKEATWDDVYNKAKRLVQSGNVTLQRNGANDIVASVVGDHGTYPVEIKRDDPSSQSITGSNCGCDWGQFQNLPRTRQWKRFQNRPCAHILAAYWQSRATPLDEDRAPGNYGQPGQMAMPGMGGPTQAPSSMGLMQQMMRPSPSPQGAPPGGGGQMAMPMGDQGAAPTPESALPQFPMDPSLQPQHNPISTPGGKAQTPLNPLQYPQGPGGTFSSWRPARMARMSAQTYQNGDLAELLNDDQGTLVGRSEEHGAGQPFMVPKGQVGEVLGTHPATGMVNVLYMGKPFDQNGPMEPYGATAWHFPSDLKPRPDLKKPGPAIRRPRGAV